MHCITLFYTKITLFIPVLYGLHTSKHRRLSTLLNINFMPKRTIKPAEIPTGFYRADMPMHIFYENKNGDFSRENSRNFPLAKRKTHAR